MKIDLQRKILLNPGPVTTSDGVKKALIVPDICHREKEFSQLIQKIREGLKRIVHAGNQFTTVLFASSGTGAVEATISSVIPHGKKLAVISNGSYGERIIDIAKTYNIECIPIFSPYNESLSLEKISSTLEKNPEIASVAMVHHETSTGMLNPLHEVGTLVRKMQRDFIVDAISSYAGTAIDVEKNQIDYLIGTSNKCLQGMPGASFVICNKDKLNLHQSNPRSFYFDLYAQNQSLDQEGVLRFTPSVQIFYALQQALVEYFSEGESARIERYKNNFRILVEGLKGLDFTFLLPEECWSHLLILIAYPFSKKKISFNEVHDYLYQRGYTIYPSKLTMQETFRLACFGDLTSKDIDNFLVLLRESLDSAQSKNNKNL